MRIYKEFFFEAAHLLPSAPPGHPNARVHGHSFRVRVAIDGEPHPDTGVVMPLDDLEAVVSGARDALDHRFLNDVEGLAQPTLERIARFIFDELKGALPELAAVTVQRPSLGESCTYRRA